MKKFVAANKLIVKWLAAATFLAEKSQKKKSDPNRQIELSICPVIKSSLSKSVTWFNPKFNYSDCVR